MPRTIIDIPDEQMRAVDALCKALSISRAEAVRRGLAEFVRQNTMARTESFGLWTGAEAALVPAASPRGGTGRSARPRRR